MWGEPDKLPAGGAPRAVEGTPEGDARLPSETELLKATFDNMRLGFLLIDEHWRVKSFNALLSDLMGYPPGVVRVGVSVDDLIHAAVRLDLYPAHDLDKSSQAWRRRFRKRRHGRRIARLSNGRALEVGYSPFGADSWIVTYEDISERIDAEEALAEQNERFEAALTNIPHGVCMFDADKRLILCNAGYAQLYALPPELTVAGTPLQAHSRPSRRDTAARRSK